MHTIESIMNASMDKIRQISDVDTAIGTPLAINENVTVIPISKICMGFLSGGGEYGQDEKVKKSNAEFSGGTSEYPFAGVAAQCMYLSPIGFLSIANDNVTMLPVEYCSPVDRLIDVLLPLVTTLTKKQDTACTDSCKKSC